MIAELLDHLAVGVEPVGVGAGALAARLGALALGRHLALEAGQVDVDRALAGDLLRELEREAVRVVEQERGRARQAGVAAESSSSRIDEPGLERVAEALLLAGQHAER